MHTGIQSSRGTRSHGPTFEWTKVVPFLERAAAVIAVNAYMERKFKATYLFIRKHAFKEVVDINLTFNSMV
jgi:hypothetical protein